MRFFLFLFLYFAHATGFAEFDHSHQKFDKVLKKFVHMKEHYSQVDYKKLKANPEDLNQYIHEIESLKELKYNAFTEKQKIAFLVNAYNALTLKLIIQNYPVVSIKKIGGFFSSPWKKEFFSLFGEQQNLDHIEHDLLRKKFIEPRIHFALVCASVGCPALLNEVYRGKTLDSQLEKAAKIFLTDTSRNRYNAKNKEIEVSSIFKWFGDDFNKTYGSYHKYIADKITDDQKIQAKIASQKIDVEYLDYDWSLNDKK